jgi:thiamine pyrophosphokinase
VLGPRDVVLHAPPGIALDLPVGTRLSLFPMDRVTGQSTGLAWPIDGLEFHPARRIGTSNLTTGTPVHLGFDRPGMLLILPRCHLRAALSALAAAAVWSRADGAASL